MRRLAPQLMTVAILVLLLAACQPNAFQFPVSENQPSANLAQVTVTFTNDSIDVSPAEVPAGLTTITMDNQSDSHAGGPIGRFKDGMTMDDFAAAENPFAAIMVFDLYGSLSGLPGAERSVTVDLQPGSYVFLGQMGRMGRLSVTDADAVAPTLPPVSNVDVVMIDFAYDMPSRIPAGEQVWHIRNDGEQLHEFLIVPIEVDTTVDEAGDIFRSMGNVFNVMAGTSPVNPLMIWGPLSPGHSAWVPISLEAGTYALGGLLPDFTTVGTTAPPTLQLDHGMVHIITVE